MNDELYSRQSLFPPIGKEGQARIRASTVLVAGCGAVGSSVASHLARAGVGRLILCDRDRVELSNLPRQTLFEREDAVKGIPKVEAARTRLNRVNPDILVETHHVELSSGNLENLARDADCLADGADNFALRFVVNDAALRLGIPWVYTGVIAGTGHSLTVPAGGKPCLRCYIRDLPPEGSVATCDTAGVIGPAVSVMGARSAAEILRILIGLPPVGAGRLTVADIWNGTLRRVRVEADPDCPACVAGNYEFLEDCE